MANNGKPVIVPNTTKATNSPPNQIVIGDCKIICFFRSLTAFGGKGRVGRKGPKVSLGITQ